MGIKDRNNNELSVGDKVKHFSRKFSSGEDMPCYTGHIASIVSERLPLVGVDCGIEFTRWIPHKDLIKVSQ